MAEHSGGGFVVRAQVNIQGGFFPLCVCVCYTADTRVHREEKGGNINYQVVERRYTVNTREEGGGGVGEKDGRHTRGEHRWSFVRDAPRGRSIPNLWTAISRRSAREIAKFRNARKTAAEYITAGIYARCDKNNARKIVFPR
jgi:hypothetical protein